MKTYIYMKKIQKEYKHIIKIKGEKIMKLRGFEIVKENMRKHPNAEIQLPLRGTSKAMAYDFFSPIETVIKPGEKQLIFTDVKAYMQDCEALILNPRSSMGKVDIVFANTQGWVDARSEEHTSELQSPS